VAKANVNEVADYILWYFQEAGQPITNLKLQKLLYYVQAWHLAVADNEPLFDSTFKAWTHGPVNTETYHRFKDFRWNPIEGEINKPELPQDALELIDEVLENYGEFSAYQLEYLTHQERPWLEARGDLEPDEASTAVIKNESMAEFYRSQLQAED